MKKIFVDYLGQNSIPYSIRCQHYTKILFIVALYIEKKIVNVYGYIPN